MQTLVILLAMLTALSTLLLLSSELPPVLFLSSDTFPVDIHGSFLRWNHSVQEMILYIIAYIHVYSQTRVPYGG